MEKTVKNFLYRSFYTCQNNHYSPEENEPVLEKTFHLNKLFCLAMTFCINEYFSKITTI